MSLRLLNDQLLFEHAVNPGLFANHVLQLLLLEIARLFDAFELLLIPVVLLHVHILEVFFLYLNLCLDLLQGGSLGSLCSFNALIIESVGKTMVIRVGTGRFLKLRRLHNVL